VLDPFREASGDVLGVYCLILASTSCELQQISAMFFCLNGSDAIEKTMARRISVDVEGFENALEELAEHEERKIAQLARVLLKEAVEAKMPKKDNSPAAQFLRRLEQKDLPQNDELVIVAHEIGVSVELLKKLCDCLTV
jgi:hypothetical protein